MIDAVALPVAESYDTYSDEQLSRRVHNYLASRQPAGGNSVEVRASGGIVTVRGSVSSFYQRQLYIHGAQRVAGVLRVVDEIDVRPPARELWGCCLTPGPAYSGTGGLGRSIATSSTGGRLRNPAGGSLNRNSHPPPRAPWNWTRARAPPPSAGGCKSCWGGCKKSAPDTGVK
jgi:hypothetical protein